MSFREGSPADLRETFALSERTMQHLAVKLGYLAAGERSDAQPRSKNGQPQ